MEETSVLGKIVKANLHTERFGRVIWYLEATKLKSNRPPSRCVEIEKTMCRSTWFFETLGFDFSSYRAPHENPKTGACSGTRGGAEDTFKTY